MYQKANNFFFLCGVAEHIAAYVKPEKDHTVVYFRHCGDSDPYNHLRVVVCKSTTQGSFKIEYTLTYKGSVLASVVSDDILSKDVPAVLAALANDLITIAEAAPE